MMQSLRGLEAGEYMGCKKIKLSSKLEEIPVALFDLWESVEFLDLSENCLSSLPEEFSRLQKLQVLFCSNNHFKEYPPILSRLKSLRMVAFKSNGMCHISEDSLGSSLRWLILTNNSIAELPHVSFSTRKRESSKTDCEVNR